MLQKWHKEDELELKLSSRINEEGKVLSNVTVCYFTKRVVDAWKNFPLGISNALQHIYSGKSFAL